METRSAYVTPEQSGGSWEDSKKIQKNPKITGRTIKIFPRSVENPKKSQQIQINPYKFKINKTKSVKFGKKETDQKRYTSVVYPDSVRINKINHKSNRLTRTWLKPNIASLKHSLNLTFLKPVSSYTEPSRVTTEPSRLADSGQNELSATCGKNDFLR